ncbi:hypothetical protein [Flavobacterium sp. ZB4P23]|nr:hypothetical protein [Flavobacterium sp. ZB4P23]
MLGALVQEIKVTLEAASMVLSSYSSEMYFITVNNQDDITRTIIKK